MTIGKKYNLWFVPADQWPAHLPDADGRGDIDTPTLDQLARNGVRFINCFSECLVCLLARRSMMTGTDPRTKGDRVFTPDMVMPELPLLAEAMVILLCWHAERKYCHTMLFLLSTMMIPSATESSM